MADERMKSLLDRIGGWDGFAVAGVSTRTRPSPMCSGCRRAGWVIELRPTAGATKRCSNCGQPVREIHDTSVRRVRDLPTGEWTRGWSSRARGCGARDADPPSERCRGWIAISISA